MKITWNVGNANDEKRSCSEVPRRNRRAKTLCVMDVKPVGLMVTLGGN